MIPTILLGTAKIPYDGGELTLTERDNEFAIKLKGVHGELMSSRMYSSELALAELGCAHLQEVENAGVSRWHGDGVYSGRRSESDTAQF